MRGGSLYIGAAADTAPLRELGDVLLGLTWVLPTGPEDEALAAAAGQHELRDRVAAAATGHHLRGCVSGTLATPERVRAAY